MLKQLLAVFTRIANELEAANVLASTSNRLNAEKNELSRDVLAFQRQLLEAEQSRTVVHVRPDLGTLTTEVSKELSKQVRQAGSNQV